MLVITHACQLSRFVFCNYMSLHSTAAPAKLATEALFGKADKLTESQHMTSENSLTQRNLGRRDAEGIAPRCSQP